MKKMSYLILGSLALLVFSCTKDSGSLDVTYFKAEAIYADLEESRATPLNAPTTEIENPGKIYIGEDFILIGEEGKGVHVLDNSNRTNPTTINFINIPGNREFFVEGNMLYAESIYDFVKIDISNLQNAVLDARINDVIATPSYNAEGKALMNFNFTEVTETLKIGSDEYINATNNNMVYFDYLNNVIPPSAVPSSFAGTTGQSGTVNRVAVNGDNMYVINKSNLIILEDDGAQLNLLSNERIGWGNTLETVFVHEDALFLGTTNSMEVYDVSTPTSPRQLDRYDHTTSCDPVYPIGNVAYVTLRTGDERMCPGDVNALVTLNIDDFSNVYETSQKEMISPFGMTSKGEVLYVGEGENGLKMFNISDAERPSLIKFDQGIEAYDIITHPSNDGQILIAGPQGLSQYTIDEAFDFQLESTIQF